MIKAISEIAPDIDISSVYKKTPLSNYFSGESLLPVTKREDSVEVSTS
jgi:hypothetical protein